MTEQKFKVGDRVRCIEPGSYEMLKVGTTGVVTGKTEWSYALYVKTDEGFPTGYIYACRFEKIEEPEPPRKGDKVRVVIEGEFIAENLGSVAIKQDGYGSVHFGVDGVDGAGVEVIERAEPEVTEFKAGDLIEGQRFGSMWLLLEDPRSGERTRAYSLTLGGVVEDRWRVIEGDPHYRLVSRNWGGIAEVSKANS